MLTLRLKLDASIAVQNSQATRIRTFECPLQYFSVRDKLLT